MKRPYLFICLALITTFAVISTVAFPVEGQLRPRHWATITAIYEQYDIEDMQAILTGYPSFSSDAVSTIQAGGTGFGSFSFLTPAATVRQRSTSSVLTPLASATPIASQTPLPASIGRDTSNPSSASNMGVDNSTSPEMPRPFLNTTMTIVWYWILGLGGLFVLGWMFNKYSLRAVHIALSNAEIRTSLVEYLIGFVYRTVIFLLVIFFYLSFAIIAAWIVVGGLNIVLAFSVSPLIFLVILAFVASAFLRFGKTFYYGLFTSPPVAEGRRLRRSEAPDLWHLVREVAQELGTRPVDTIYISPASQIGVWETGSILTVIFGQGSRNMILGIDSLNTLTVQELKAILAHEYSHFTNRDTSFGGFLSLRVYYTIDMTRRWLIAQRENSNTNIVWLFLRIFYPLFIRVTLGASQMQEVVADRNAAAKYGAQSAADGLLKLTRRAIRFDIIMQSEVNKALQNKDTIPNLYEVEATEEIEEAIDNATNQMLLAPSGTHPPTIIRLAFFKKFGERNIYLAEKEEELASVLVPNLPDLQAEMMDHIKQNIARQLWLLQHLQARRGSSYRRNVRVRA